VREDDLKSTFGQFGPVDTVEIARDAGTGVCKGFAIVSMSRDEDAVKAIGRLNFTQYAGRTIGVSRFRPSGL
jgi:RNA recognition motif-containing protein